MPKRKRVAAKPHGKHVFISIVRNCQTCFQSARAISHSQQEWMRDPVSLHPCQHVVLIIFHFGHSGEYLYGYIMVIVTICVSMMSNEVEHPFLMF